jgi:hypothetical protein
LGQARVQELITGTKLKAHAGEGTPRA